MAFEVRDYYDFVRLLYQHPEWQEELRDLLIAKEIRELPQLVRELAESQKRTDAQLQLLTQRVDALAEAQKRSEERLSGVEERLTRLEQVVAELAEAQKRSEERLSGVEERLTRLEQVVAELAEAQKRTEQRVDKLADELQKTRSEVAGLAATIGATLEEEAMSVVTAVMEQKEYRLLTEPTPLRLDGEVDVILLVETPEGRRLSVVVESKARLSARDISVWHQRMQALDWQKRLETEGYPGPYLFYFFAIRADSGARNMAAKLGIGLLKGEGEVLAPSREFGA